MYIFGFTIHKKRSFFSILLEKNLIIKHLFLFNYDRSNKSYLHYIPETKRQITVSLFFFLLEETTGFFLLLLVTHFSQC